VKKKLASIKAAATIFNKAVIAEVTATHPELTADMEVNWNISLYLCI